MKTNKRTFNVLFKPALIPEAFSAEARINHGDGIASYQIFWQEEGTRFPLVSWKFKDNLMLRGAGPILEDNRGWLTDLDVVESPTLVAVRTHGDNRKPRDSFSVQTTWFLHLADHPDEIWVNHRLERRAAPLYWEVADPSPNLKIEGVGIETTLRKKTVLVRAPEAERWSFRLATTDRLPVLVRIEILPPENDRGFVDYRHPIVIPVVLRNISKVQLSGARLTLYGFEEIVSSGIDLVAGESKTIRIHVERTDRRGIVPIAVRLDHPAGVGLGARSIWIPQVVLETDQPWLDGMYAENLRSMVHRFTFNTWREDEPRFPCYYNGVFPRNINTGLIAMDRPRRLWDWTRLWFMALRSCGYMPETLPMVPPPVRSEKWLGEETGGGDYGAIDNAGAGFTLIEWGKLFLRADDELRREMVATDLNDLFYMERHLKRFLHWDGRIEDHSEPIEGFAGKMVVGSPYAQAICLAGTLLVKRALKEALNFIPDKREELQSLMNLYDFLAKKLRTGLDIAVEKNGCFADITFDQGQSNPHTYTNLAPGMVLTDPDLGGDGYREWEVLKQTVDSNKTYHPPSQPYRILTCPCYSPHSGLSHNAYSQIGMIINCLSLGLEEDAGHYLTELILDIRSADPASPISIEPHPKVWKWKVNEPEFARYIIPEGKMIGLDDLKKLNPGNGVNVTYFTYMIDRMIGITPRGKKIEIRPLLAGQKYWSIFGYPTRLGLVSYRVERSDTGIEAEFNAEARSIISLRISRDVARFLSDGSPHTFQIAEENRSRVISFTLSKGLHCVSIKYAGKETADRQGE